MMMIMMRILLLGIHGPFMHQWATTTFANSIELIHAPLVNQFGQNEPSHGLATISPSRNMTHPAFLPSCHTSIRPSCYPTVHPSNHPSSLLQPPSSLAPMRSSYYWFYIHIRSSNIIRRIRIRLPWIQDCKSVNNVDMWEADRLTGGGVPVGIGGLARRVIWTMA